jgi:transposase
MARAVQVTRRDHSAADLRRAACTSEDVAQSRCLLALAMVLDGETRQRAAARSGLDRQTLCDWVHRYNAAGIKGLRSRKSPGKVALLTDAQKAALNALVLAGPDPARHQGVRWRCVDLQGEIARRFSVEVHESTVGKWLHPLGLAAIKPRPYHPQRELEKQETYKKLLVPAEGKAARLHGRNTDRDLVPGRGEGGASRAVSPASGPGAGLVQPWCATTVAAPPTCSGRSAQRAVSAPPSSRQPPTRGR